MSWLKKVMDGFRKPKTEQVQPANSESAKAPIHVDLIPEKLSAKVYLHTLETKSGPINCWTYMSKGFMAHQQKELAFTLVRNRNQPEDSFPRDPLTFFISIFPLAENGQLVDVGDFSELGTPSFLGHKSIIYVAAQPFAEFIPVGFALAIILLKDEELVAVKSHGHARVVSRLGHTTRYYPCPPWFDPTRRAIPFAETLQQSIIT